MERFAIKIDKKLKANLYKICRLCGIDNPEMVPILSSEDVEASNENINEVMDVEAEPEMPQKIKLLIGLVVTKDDKMPQTMCSLCVDKINDFYEFREMCYATNAQTRKLLGLKSLKKPVPDIKPKLEIKEEQILPKVNTPKAKVVGKDFRKRKQDEPEEIYGRESRKRKQDDTIPLALTLTKKENVLPAVSNKKLRLASIPLKEAAAKKVKQKFREEYKDLEIKEEIKEEPKDEKSLQATVSLTAAPNSSTQSQVNKFKHICSICSERFATKSKLESHTRLHHVPKVERFVCTACNETISKGFDIKNHQLWHKLSKTPYVCGLCGESILSIYAYTRHVKEHSFETPPALLVLDRECPQCHVSYATNYLYNTHPCAIKAKRCAGCNRLQRSDAEFLKHSALCAKVYLSYSKHIMPAVEAQEDAVRIKNENDVEAAAEEMARITGMPLDMAPIVQLTRLSSPLIMAATQPSIEDSPSTSSRKTGKKGMSKKELKRVDELLKSTIDALVSIKHEPEVHVDTEPPAVNCRPSDNEGGSGNSTPNMDIGFQDEDDSDNDEKMSVSETQNDQIVIKKEIIEPHETPTSGGGLKLKIRKEHGQLNSSIIEQQKTDDKPAEKRKKKKKHKDKVKEKLKNHRDQQEEQNSLDSFNTQHNEENISSAESPGGVRIKAEPLEETDTDASSIALVRQQPETMIMTSIPMMQLQIACISEGVDFNNSNVSTAVPAECDQENRESTDEASDAPIVEAKISDDVDNDVKPNRKELDRLMKISHISSGVEIANEEEENAVDQEGNPQNHNNEVNINYENIEKEQNTFVVNQANPSEEEANSSVAELPISGKQNEYQKHSSNTGPIKQKTSLNKYNAAKSRNKACKSTAKPSFAVPESPALQISSVISGVSLSLPSESQIDYSPVFIKPEPLNRGYSDEYTTLPSSAQNDSDKNTFSIRQNSHISTPNEEQAYISSIDFNNITIKQEKDLEINDVQVGVNTPRYCDYSFNGIKKHNNAQRLSKKITNSMEESNEMQLNDKERPDDSDIGGEEEELDEDHYDDDEEEEDDVDEEEAELEEEEEEREYRELDYPPEMKTCEEKHYNNNLEDIIKTSGENARSNQHDELSSMSDFVISNVYSHASKPMDLDEDSKKNTLPSAIDNKSVILEETPVLKISSISSGFNVASLSNEKINDLSAEIMDTNEYEITESKSEVNNITIKESKCSSTSSTLNLLSNKPSDNDNVSNNTNLGLVSELSAVNTDVDRFNLKHQTKTETESNSAAFKKSSKKLEQLDSSVNLSGQHEKVFETNILTNTDQEADILQYKERSSDLELHLDKKVSAETINTPSIGATTSSSITNKFNNDTRSETIELHFEQENDFSQKAKPHDSSTYKENEIEMHENEENNDDNENFVDEEEDEEPNKDEAMENAKFNIDSLVTLNLEEQQNQQNQQQLQEIQTDLGQPTALALHPYLEDISSSSNSFLSNTLSQTPPPTQQSNVRHSVTALNHSEETENILNESADVGFVRHASLDFDNINEIAENNNNANLEREQLQDDQQHRNNVALEEN